MLAAESARGIAEERVTWAQNMGVDAFGAVVRQSADALAEAIPHLYAAHTECQQADAALAGADTQPGLTVVGVQVTAVATRLCSPATAALSAAADRVGATYGLAFQSQDRDLIAAVETAMTAIDEATAVVARAATAVDELAVTVRASTENTSGAGDPPDSGPPSTPKRGIPGFTHRRPVPEAVDAIRREGWPRNAQGRISARGNLYDEHGVTVNDQVIRPHRKGEAPPCDELREPWRSDFELTTTWHAERDAAKMMRDKQMQYAVLYLNIPTCGKESRHLKRCDANLEKILPHDAELHVWSIHEDDSMARRRYFGTGEAIT